MKINSSSKFISMLLAATMLGPAYADNVAKTEHQKKAEYWQNMTPEQQQQVRERHERFKQLPPEEQKRLKEGRKKFKNMPEQERQQMREKWLKMTPEQRQHWRDKFKNN